MTGRLAIDFGTSNTVIAVWDEAQKEGKIHHISNFGQIYKQENESISVIPSLIHYASDGRRWIGQQVIQRGLKQSPRTFRWMKRYISNRSPIHVRLEDKEYTPYLAGNDFLSTILLFTSQEFSIGDEEIAFSVPVDSYEHYENWLVKVAESAGFPRFRLIDEPSAAALGYGAHIQPGHVYLIFDFGGGTLHVSVVLMESDENSQIGRRCRVLGKAGKSIGGTTIDQWLFEEVLKRNHCSDNQEEIRRISNALLVECEHAKEALSFSPHADISVVNPETGTAITATIQSAEFETILENQNLFADINQLVRSALNEARERGYDEDAIHSVLMVGGSSQIPSVQRTLRQIFGKEKVHFNRPLDAIARGAAAFIAGVDFFDHIQHDYAIRYINPETNTYNYHVIVKRGTTYPTSEPISRLAVKASYDGQKKLGLAIFEMGQQRSNSSQPLELVFDPGGAARVVKVTPYEQEQRNLFWMNENSPTFLTVDPPARQGEPRFEIEFQVDANKRLTIAARDLISGQMTHNGYPVIRLS